MAETGLSMRATRMSYIASSCQTSACITGLCKEEGSHATPLQGITCQMCPVQSFWVLAQ